MTTVDPRALCEEAVALRNGGQLEEALALFKQAYLRNTEDFKVHHPEVKKMIMHLASHRLKRTASLFKFLA